MWLMGNVHSTGSTPSVRAPWYRAEAPVIRGSELCHKGSAPFEAFSVRRGFEHLVLLEFRRRGAQMLVVEEQPDGDEAQQGAQRLQRNDDLSHRNTPTRLMAHSLQGRRRRHRKNAA